MRGDGSGIVVAATRDYLTSVALASVRAMKEPTRCATKVAEGVFQVSRNEGHVALRLSPISTIWGYDSCALLRCVGCISKDLNADCVVFQSESGWS